jgi:hypothetical protein
MAENTIVTAELTYKVPNSLYSQSDSDSKTVTASYTGPDRCWVFPDTDGVGKGKLGRNTGFKLAKDDGGDLPVPNGCTRVLVTAADDLLIMAILMQDSVTIAGQSQTTESLPDGTSWSENAKLELGQAYAGAENLEYDLDGEAWETPAYHAAPTTWDTVISSRNNMLLASDGKIADDMPDAVKAPWAAYRTKLRDIPATYNKGDADEIAPWKVTWPLAPDTVTE